MKKFITLATVAAMFLAAGTMISTDAFAKKHKMHKKHKHMGAHQTMKHTPGAARHSGS
jgi:hypothetical protein